MNGMNAGCSSTKQVSTGNIQKDMSEMDRVLDQIDSSISRIENKLCNLRTQLTPIMSPENPQTPCGASSVEVYSPLGQQLSIYQSRLMGIEMVLNDLGDRTVL
jgi:hypothetical protein